LENLGKSNITPELMAWFSTGLFGQAQHPPNGAQHPPYGAQTKEGLPEMSFFI
jgi:hypothetical protein